MDGCDLIRGMINTTFMLGSILISARENWRSTEFSPKWGRRHYMCVFTYGGLQHAVRDAIWDALRDARNVHRGCSPRDVPKNLLRQVYFLFERVMQTVLTAMPEPSYEHHEDPSSYGGRGPEVWVTTGSQPFHFWQQQSLNSGPYCQVEEIPLGSKYLRQQGKCSYS